MKGAGTNDSLLIRIVVSRSEVRFTVELDEVARGREKGNEVEWWVWAVDRCNVM